MVLVGISGIMEHDFNKAVEWLLNGFRVEEFRSSGLGV